MPKEIIISVSGDQSRIAIVEDGELVELYVENPENVRTIGDIYLARIRRILPGIKAAFVDVGQKQDAFLHFSDLSDNVPALLELADGKVREHSAAELSKEPAAAEAAPDEEATAAGRQRGSKRQPSRGRGAKKAPEAQQATAEEAAPADEEQKQERGRRRRAPRSEDPAGASGNGAPSAPAILPPEAVEGEPAVVQSPDEQTAAPTQESAEEEKARPKRRRGRRRKPADEAASEQEAPAAAEEQEQRKPSRRGRSSKPAEPKADPLVAKPVAGPVKGGSEAAGDDAPEATSTPRLAPSSRFRIDLTGGSPDTTRATRREEEEEEEERTSSRRRRKSRSGGDRRRQKSSSRSGAKGNGKSADQNPGDNDDDDDDRGSGTVPMVEDGKAPQDYLKQDQRIVVKIIKEPISTKGPRVSTDVSLAGRFLVLVPAADYVAVSKKIDSAKERRRLRALARSLLPEGLGLIVRTVAEGRDAKTLDADLQLLLQKWRKIEDQLRQRPDPPARLFEDVNMVSSIIRDLFSEDYDKIVVDDQTVYRHVKNYVQAVAPQMSEKVQLHRGKEPVFRTYKIERDIRAAFESRVSLPGGGYLIIEHTEAMHVVDVNSGRAGKGLTQEQNALKVNLEAAQEIAKQLRLRDLGGIICVDFIDMRSDAYRRKLFDELKRAFRRDRAVTKMLPLSDFGVLEITRQRLRPSITTTLDVEDLGEATPEEEEDVQPRAETHPRRERSASDVVSHLERWLTNYRDHVQEQHRKRPILIRVHPFTAAYLQRGIPSVFTRWRFKMRLKLNLEVDDSVDPLSFTARDEKSGKNLTRRFDPDR
jgi:Rne/Rng family ribonuclease